MKYFVKINEEEFKIELSENNDDLNADVNGKTYHVAPAVVEEGVSYSVIIDGESFNVSLNSNSNNLDLIIGGRLYHAEVLDEREKGAMEIDSSRKDGGLQVVQSVMPGIVRKVFVKEGDTVTEGSSLLILEAMKMENELAAEKEGLVVKVHIKEGQTVNSSDPLITIE